MQPWWQKDQVIAAFVVGSFSLTTTLISILVNSRRTAQEPERKPARKTRRRRVGVMFIAGVIAGGMVYRFGIPALNAVGMTLATPIQRLRATASAFEPLVPGREPDASPGGAGSTAAAGGAAAAAVPAPGDSHPGEAADDVFAALAGAFAAPDSGPAPEPPPGLSEWLRATEMRIQYRHVQRLPDACDGAAVAYGNWPEGEAGAPVQCADSGWLVFDVAPLVEAGKVTPNIVYCFNLRNGAGRWARHDGAPSPGLDRVAVPSTTGTWGPAPLGFRVVRTEAGPQIELLNAEPRLLC